MICEITRNCEIGEGIASLTRHYLKQVSHNVTGTCNSQLLGLLWNGTTTINFFGG